MQSIIMDNVPFQPNLTKLMRKLHAQEGKPYTEKLKQMIQEAQAIVRPRALYKVAYVESRNENSVVLDGFTFTSRVLTVNLEKAQRAFPFIVTCGTELDQWTKSQEDLLLRYYADAISETALRLASTALKKRLKEQYRLGRTSSMSPGSLADWPIEAQRRLFALLGSPQEAIGVILTDSFLMIPVKSVSGIRFPTEQTFASCQLCARENCSSRLAPYDEALYERRYHLQAD